MDGQNDAVNGVGELASPLADGDNSGHTSKNANSYKRKESSKSWFSPCCDRNQSGPSTVEIVLLGQIISFLMSSAGAAQATLYFDCSISVPTLSTAFVYACLSCLLIPFYFRARRIQQLGTALATVDSALSGVDDEDEEEGDDNHVPYSPTGETNLQGEYLLYSPYSLFGIIPLSSSLWFYFLVALLDVEANYVTVLAFKYTTLTSVNLFDALAIPSAMILSRMFLKRSYISLHIFGALVCMVGITINVFTDYRGDQEAKHSDSPDKEVVEQEYPHRMFGDCLAILGGLIWGADNVVQEFAIRGSGMPFEFLGMLGFFGTVISVVQIALLERDDFSSLFGPDRDDSTCGQGKQILLIMSYVGSVVLLMWSGAYFLLHSEAALYNLSLLTSDLWTATFSILAERIVPPPMFFVALILIVSGVVLYETGPSPVQIEETEANSNVGRDVELPRKNNSILSLETARIASSTSQNII